MPSLTLLAADPHLTPVRARPALAFSGRDAGGPHQGRARRTRLTLPLRRRRGAQEIPEPAASRSGASPEAATGGAGNTPRATRRLSLRRRGTPRRPRQGSIFGWRSAVAAAVVLLIVTGLSVLRVWPPFAVVMSGSMAPTIDTGDMVVLQRLHAPARVGEVVAVSVPDDARSRYGYPPVVIHRVFRITDGQIRTKGDARPAADPFTVPRDAVHAKVVADIPAGGRILSFFHSGPGLVWLLFGAVLFFGLPLLDRLRDARGLEAEATADLRDQLAAVSARLAHLQAEQEHSRRTADEALGQLDHLTRLVTEALGQPRQAADDGVRAPADNTGPAERQGDAAAAAQTSVSSPGPEPSAAPSASVGLASVLDPAPDFGTELPPATEGEAQPGPAVQPSAVAQASPTADSVSGVGAAASAHGDSVEEAPEELARTAQAASTALPADEPALDLGPAPAAAPVIVTRPEVSDAAGELGLGPVRESVLVPLDDTIARSAGDVIHVLAPLGLGPVAATFARWDAPPPASSANAGGWAAPPTPARSSRFQRPGRLVAASLAQPSPAA